MPFLWYANCGDVKGGKETLHKLVQGCMQEGCSMSLTMTQLQSHPGRETDLDIPVLIPAEQRVWKVQTCGLTDRGRTRPRNEDQFLIAVMTKALQIRQTSLPRSKMEYSDERGFLFIVADGMGGHQAGELASALAVSHLEKFVLNTLKWFLHFRGAEGQTVLSDFHAALQQADAQICKEAAQRPEWWGMGTTLTMAYCLHRDLFIAHVGDSRCYLFRGGELHQLTHDHTLVQEMVRRGVIAPEEGHRHHLRHVITNVLGSKEPGVMPEVHKAQLEAGDVMLLCSDGLTEMVPDDEIASVLNQEADVRPACERLIALANDKGGKDNITAIVARYDWAEHP
jgi:protein phosphatase